MDSPHIAEMEDTASLRDYLLRVGINISCDTGGSGGGSTFSAGVYTLCGGGTGALWMDAGTRERSPNWREWQSATLLAALILWATTAYCSGRNGACLRSGRWDDGHDSTFHGACGDSSLRNAEADCTVDAGAACRLGRRDCPGGPTMKLSGAPLDRVGAMALIAGAMSWSVASAMARKLPLPTSKAMSSGAQMLAGGVLLGLVSGRWASGAVFIQWMFQREHGSRCCTWWLQIDYRLHGICVVAAP